MAVDTLLKRIPKMERTSALGLPPRNSHCGTGRPRTLILRRPVLPSPQSALPNPSAPASSAPTLNTSPSSAHPPSPIPPKISTATPPPPDAIHSVPRYQKSVATSPKPLPANSREAQIPKYPVPAQTPLQTFRWSRSPEKTAAPPPGRAPTRAQTPLRAPAATISVSPTAPRPQRPAASTP